MVNTLLIPFHGELLALDLETFEEARRRGRELVPAPATPVSAPNDLAQILDADGIASRTGIPASWFLEQSRRGTIPHIKAGKYTRFALTEVLAALKVDKRITTALEPVRLRRRVA